MCFCIFQATHFRSPLLQQTENQVSSATAHQGQQAVTDVIQQLLELSEPGPVENNQPQQPGQQLNFAVGINRDILQVKGGVRSASHVSGFILTSILVKFVLGIFHGSIPYAFVSPERIFKDLLNEYGVHQDSFLYNFTKNKIINTDCMT